ncbi:MAG: MFS transporter [Anaerolineae bacterium]
MAWTALARFRQQGASISRNARLFLWMVFLSNVGVSGVFLLLYNLYLVQLGYNEDFIGLLTLVQMGAIAIGAVPAGSLSERFGSKRVMVAGTVVVGFSTTGMCLFTQPGLLALLNFATGIGFAMRIVPYTPFLVRNTTRAERTLVFAANSAAISIAGTFGNLVGGQLPAIFDRVFSLGGGTSIPAYRLSLVVGALIGILAAIPMAIAGEDTTYAANGAGSAATPAPPEPSTAVRRDVVSFVAVTALFAISGACISPFTNVYFSRVLHLQASAISLVFSLSSVLAALATVGASSVAERLGKVRAMVYIRLAGLPLLLLVALFSNVWIGISAIVLRNVSEMASWPLDGAFLAEVVPVRRQARIVAFRSVAWNGCWAVTGFLAGQVIVRVGYSPLFAAAGILLVIGAATYHFAFSRHEAAPPPA